MHDGLECQRPRSVHRKQTLGSLNSRDQEIVQQRREAGQYAGIDRVLMESA